MSIFCLFRLHWWKYWSSAFREYRICKWCKRCELREKTSHVWYEEM
jgi:hypothetical protein